MNVTDGELPEVKIVETDVFGDARGFFTETWRADRYAGAGLPERFVQDNVSRSARGVLRGLHLQHPHAQGKLVYCLEGEVFDVAVDVRAGSPSFGRWMGVWLSGPPRRQLYIPPGFAHGFCVKSETALVAYKCTDVYHPEAEIGVAWNDPDLGIRWPDLELRVSDRDAKFPRLRDVPPDRLPPYTR
jgi:dTDP-4-dehydrorhamnose 3,5-epimerase